MILLIQGIFFQQATRLGVRGGNPIAVTQDEYGLFSGVLTNENDHLGFRGAMQDNYGESQITEVVYEIFGPVHACKLRFQKKYNHRSGIINYAFEGLTGEELQGSWNGEEVGRGTARCFIREVTPDFFDPVK